MTPDEYREKKVADSTEAFKWLFFVGIPVLLILALLSGCANFGENWRYEGPDVSAKTSGPFITSREQINSACLTEQQRMRGENALGCFVPKYNAINLRVDATRNYLNLCRLPDVEPETTEEHEWCHAKGWRHDLLSP